MNFSHFLEILLHQSFSHCNRPNAPKYAHTEIQKWTDLSCRNNVYNAKCSVETRLDHDFAIEYAYFQ